MPAWLAGKHTCPRAFVTYRRSPRTAARSLCQAYSRRNVKVQCAVQGELSNLYELLGVQPTASERDIKVAFRRRALESHPDISKEAGAEVKFIQVRKAYDVLSCAARRRAYDRELRRWWAQQQRSQARSHEPAAAQQAHFYHQGGNPTTSPFNHHASSSHATDPCTNTGPRTATTSHGTNPGTSSNNSDSSSSGNSGSSSSRHSWTPYGVPHGNMYHPAYGGCHSSQHMPPWPSSHRSSRPHTSTYASPFTSQGPDTPHTSNNTNPGVNNTAQRSKNNAHTGNSQPAGYTSTRSRAASGPGSSSSSGTAPFVAHPLGSGADCSTQHSPGSNLFRDVLGRTGCGSKPSSDQKFGSSPNADPHGSTRGGSSFGSAPSSSPHSDGHNSTSFGNTPRTNPCRSNPRSSTFSGASSRNPFNRSSPHNTTPSNNPSSSPYNNTPNNTSSSSPYSSAPRPYNTPTSSNTFAVNDDRRAFAQAKSTLVQPGPGKAWSHDPFAVSLDASVDAMDDSSLDGSAAGLNDKAANGSWKWFEQVLGWAPFFQQQQQSQWHEQEWSDAGWDPKQSKQQGLDPPATGAPHTRYPSASAAGTASPAAATAGMAYSRDPAAAAAAGEYPRCAGAAIWVSSCSELQGRLVAWEAVMGKEMDAWQQQVQLATSSMQATLTDFDGKMQEKMTQSDKDMHELQQTLLQNMCSLDEQLSQLETSASSKLDPSRKWCSLMQDWTSTLSQWIRSHCTSLKHWCADMAERAAAVDHDLEQHSMHMYTTAHRVLRLIEEWDESFDTDNLEVAELWESRSRRWRERVEEVMASWFLQVGEYERAYQRRLENCRSYTQSWSRQARSAKTQWNSRLRMWNLKLVAV